MKRLCMILAAPILLGASQPDSTVVPPYSPQAQSGKETYEPLSKGLDKEEEIRLQTDNARIGANGKPMHSYDGTPIPKEDPKP